MKKHILYIALIALFVGGFSYLEARKHHAVHKPGAPFRPVETRRKLENAIFVSVNSSNFWSGLENAYKTKVTMGPATNTPHADLLFQQVQRFVQAYSKGTFDAYLDFKSGGLPCDFTFNGPNVHDLEQNLTNHNSVFSTNTAAKAQMLWNHGTMADKNKVAPRITDVSLERLTVYAGKGSGPHPPTYWAAAADTGAPQHICPSVITLKEAEDELGKSRTSEMYAVVGLPCEFDHEKNFAKAHFLHLCFFWSEKYSKWLPVEMLDDYGLKLPMQLPVKFPDSFADPIFF